MFMSQALHVKEISRVTTEERAPWVLRHSLCANALPPSPATTVQVRVYHSKALFVSTLYYSKWYTVRLDVTNDRSQDAKGRTSAHMWRPTHSSATAIEIPCEQRV